MTLPPPSRPAAGWFPDPWGSGAVRYWDGEGWTPYVAKPKGAQPLAEPEIPLRAGMVGLAVLLGSLVVSIVVSILLYALRLPDVIVFLGGAAGLYGVLVWWCRRVSRREGTGSLAGDFGLRFQWIDVALGLGTWFAATIAQVAVSIFLRALGLPLGSNTDTVRESTDKVVLFAAVALVAVVVAPIVEELFFRGLLLRSLRSRFTPGLAVLAQALVFGSIHVQVGLGRANITLILALATVGAVFGVVADRVGRLGPAIVGHACFNFMAVLVVLATR